MNPDFNTGYQDALKSEREALLAWKDHIDRRIEQIDKQIAISEALANGNFHSFE